MEVGDVVDYPGVPGGVWAASADGNRLSVTAGCLRGGQDQGWAHRCLQWKLRPVGHIRSGKSKQQRSAHLAI